MKPKLNQSAVFKKTMNDLIKEDKHADYFKEVLKQFSYYQKTFSAIFLPNARKYYPKDFVYLFRALYMGMGGGSKEVLALRDIEITGNKTFYDLAKHIIVSMGWINDHMHGFELTGKKTLPDPLCTGSVLGMFAYGWEEDPHPFFNTDEIQIADVDYSKQSIFDFTFDYGDGHTFKIQYLGHDKMSRQDSDGDFPRLVASSGVSPEQYPPIPDF